MKIRIRIMIVLPVSGLPVKCEMPVRVDMTWRREK
jgi:hypothetical protein